MRNKLFIFVLSFVTIPSILFSQGGTSVVTDSSQTSQPVHIGPLGISDTTGLAMYVVAILFLILILVLWRRSMAASKV